MKIGWLIRTTVLFVALTFSLQAQVPQIINYQGRVLVGSTNFDGSGQFKFALVNAAGTITYWSNDGTSTAGSQPTNAVPLTVTKGLYSVLLGDTSLLNMTVAIPLSVFNNADVRLRVWFNDGPHGSQLLTPDQRVAANGYAMMANSVSDGAITSAKIAAGAVGSTQLGSNLTLGGTTNGAFSGSLTGNASTASSATNFTGSLAGDVTGTQGATVVAATSANTANAIVRRDGSGSFSVGNITAAGVFNLVTTAGAGIGMISQNSMPLLHTFGTNNLFVGTAAGNFTMSGGFNTASGYQALASNTTGNGNTVSGFGALGNNTTGDANTASGQQALLSNTTGIQNTATGFQALVSNTTGSFNTAAGLRALSSNTTGAVNTAIGLQALYSNTTGNINIASGVNALFFNTTASRNVAVGNNALYTQSFDNGGVAWNSDNVAVGFEALFSNQPASPFTGYKNTAVGTQALRSNTTGGENTASGFQALYFNTQGNGNTAIGDEALYYNDVGSFNTASGYLALNSNSEGSNNTASGVAALHLNTRGASNTASGFEALKFNTTAGRNVAVGEKALLTQSFSNGGVAWNSENVAVGFEALRNNQPTTPGNGLFNTALGTQALLNNTTGGANTATGHSALRNNTLGGLNTAYGTRALQNNTGDSNTASGVNALYNNTAGSFNTAVGYSADVTAGNLTNATAIGAGAFVNASNKVRIGNTSVTVIEGQVGFTASSDRTKKENFRPVDGAEVLRKIREFKLTSWNFIGHDPKEFRHYGPMAQDFYAAFGHDAVGAIGTPTTINSTDLSGILMSAVQALDEENAALRVEAAATHKRLAELEARLTNLEQVIPWAPKAGAAIERN